MAIKNVGSSPLSGPGLSKAKESEGSKKTSVAEAGLGSANSAAAAGIASSSGKDFGVQLSDDARKRADERKKSFEIAKNTPDVREEKVAAIKAKIQAGTYEVDSGKIADGMLREAIMEHLANNKDS
jgi:negative regulator of flagellin synthesis FlgM